jgi:hypothetical protein
MIYFFMRKMDKTMLALLPVDKSTIFRSEISVSCKLIAASGDSYLNFHLCHEDDLILIEKNNIQRAAWRQKAEAKVNNKIIILRLEKLTTVSFYFGTNIKKARTSEAIDQNDN